MHEQQIARCRPIAFLSNLVFSASERIGNGNASMKILVASAIDPDAVAALRAGHEVLCAFGAGEEELCAAIVDCDVVIFRSGVWISDRVLESARKLRLILRAGSGMDNVNLDRVRARGIRFERIPGPGAKAVAELSFALMLALARHVLVADREVRQGRWPKHRLVGHSLIGKVLGVVGAGNIGGQVGRLGAAWGMKVLGCVEQPTQARATELAAESVILVELYELLERSDFVSIHVPLQASTRNMFDAATLQRMKRGAFLVNVARGGVVVEKALERALRSGHLRGAALDVHQREGEGVIPPFSDLDNVIMTPHIGAQTYEAQHEIGQIIVQSIAALEAGSGLTTQQRRPRAFL